MFIFKDRSLSGLFFATFFLFSSFTAFFPVLPLYLKNLGANNLEIGAVMSAFPIGVLVFRPIVGWLLSRKSRRWTLIFGTGVFLVTTVLYLPAHSINSLLLVRFLHGMGIAAFTTSSIVFISDLTTFENRGETMGLMGVANYLGFGLGPFFASWVYNTHNIQFVFIAAIIFAGLSLLSVLLIQPQPSQSIGQDESGVKHVLLKRFVIVPSIFVFITALIQGGVVNFLPIYLESKSGRLDAGIFFLFFSISVLFFRILAGKAADSYGRGIVIFSATILLITSLSFLSFTQSLWMLICAAVFYGGGYGSQQPTLSAYVADNTNFRTRSLIFSIYYAVFDVGMLISGYLFGALADTIGIKFVYPTAIFIYVMGMIFFILSIQDSILNSLKWIFGFRGPGKICKICYNQIGVDPCHLCGHRGGFVSFLKPKTEINQK